MHIADSRTAFSCAVLVAMLFASCTTDDRANEAATTQASATTPASSVTVVATESTVISLSDEAVGLDIPEGECSVPVYSELVEPDMSRGSDRVGVVEAGPAVEVVTRFLADCAFGARAQQCLSAEAIRFMYETETEWESDPVSEVWRPTCLFRCMVGPKMIADPMPGARPQFEVSTNVVFVDTDRVDEFGIESNVGELYHLVLAEQEDGLYKVQISNIVTRPDHDGHLHC